MKSYKGKIKKKISIKLVGDAEKAFRGLNKVVGEQRGNGIGSSKDITLLNAINRIFDIITSNPFYGENAKKYLIPKVEIIAFVLDIFNHSEYNKKFGFRKN